MTTYTLEQRKFLVAGSTIGLTAEQTEAIAVRCQEQAAINGNSSVWHNVHVVLETPDCNCLPCYQARIGETR